jgi:DNA-binding transcriptional regulator YdaS (Cro superfamily)
MDGQAALAARIGVKQQHIWNWLNRGDKVPPEYCVAIEVVTDGAVTRRHLRPDDWHLIWPEIVTPTNPAPTREAA